jgi:NAD(P)-dependent dehydrogenase (short-subunit alcohol dehydrogenase family)
MFCPDLTGIVAIVTGGGRGIGRAMALGLAEAGACVTITAAAHPEEIQTVADEANRRMNRYAITAIVADVTDGAACAQTVAHTIATFGGLHVLVNNAARGMLFVRQDFLEQPAKFWSIDAAVWRRIVDTNVNGPFVMARAACAHLISQGWGRIINISINRETMSRGGFSPYGPSKAALEAATAAWADDLRGTGVTANVLLPGGITDTGMVPADATIRQRPDAMLKPEVMVAPLRWLVSREADGITGYRFIARLWNDRENMAEAVATAGSRLV